MNTNPSWLHRVPEIIEQLALIPDSYLDRNACEPLFGLSHTATRDMLNDMGASQLGRSLVIGRALLMARLRELMEHPDYRWLAERRGRVADTVNKAKEQRALLIEPAPQLAGLSFAELPGVTITSDEIRIRHYGSQDAKQKLYALAKAMAADPEAFDAVADSKTVTSPPRSECRPKTLSAGGR